MKLAASILLFVLCPALLSAQDIPADSGSAAREPMAAEQTGISPASDSLPSAEAPGQDGAHLRTDPASAWVWSKDSVRLMEYHHLGEIVEAHPALMTLHLGNYGQPAWMSLAGAAPLQSTVTIGGLSGDNLISSQPDLYRYATEDAEAFTLFPQYQAFWYGNPGDATVIDLREKVWDAPRPVTRLRHTESANEYLYTDALFTLNPSARSNIQTSLTRTSIGGSSGNNAARFANNRFESWDIRLRYHYRLSETVRISGRLRYDEQTAMLNGGVRGTFAPMTGDPYHFEGKSVSDFSTFAFDPKAAELVNQTMYSARQHYTAEAGVRAQWSADSSQVTELRITAESDVRRFRDNLLLLYPESTFDNAALNLTDSWTLSQAVLDHRTAFDWAQLELQGRIGRYTAGMGGETLDDAGFIAHARGRLNLLLGPISLSGFGRLDHRFESSTVAFGFGGEIPIGPVALWGGTSASARPHTLMETQYTGPRVLVTGDRTPDLDKSVIAEAGVRFTSSWFSADLRGFVRSETRFLDMRAIAYTDSILGRYRLEVQELPGGLRREFYGGSIDARLSIWRLDLDQQAALLTTNGDITDLLVPQISYRAELAYRGALIEGTLDLRVGARFSYSGRFTPLIYHPETGLFVRQSVDDPALRSYTDMRRIDLFLFATIKQRATIHLVLHNLLDHAYITTGFYPMFDTAFRLGVDWVFFD
jgi:hypothetical protein